MANDRNLRPLIRRLLDSGDLLPETADELQDYLGELDRKGSLDRMDADYVEGLARRLGLDAKGKDSDGGGDRPPAAANDSGAGAPLRRARELVMTLYDPDTGLNQDISDERAAEILEALLQALDDADDALSRR